jgi:N4-gp56 family major capsid protein
MAGQVWHTNADGGYFSNPKLSKSLRTATQPMMKFRQFVRKESAAGKGKGDTFDFNKISNIVTSGGVITETQRIPESKFLIRRGQLTIQEYGNSIPYTGKVDTLSEFSVDNSITKALRDDMAKVIDIAVANVFKGSDLCYIPSSLTAGTWDVDGTPSTTASVNLNLAHIREIVDSMKTGVFGANEINPIPAYDGSNYICIASVKALRGIKSDPDYEEAKKYADPEALLSGEVGRIENVRFVECNHLDALSNGVGTGSVLGEAIIFGEDPVIEALVVPEEIRKKIPSDYGRDLGIAWYGMAGWARVWDFSSDSEERIVRITSA